METVQNQSFTNERITIDGNRYERCTFTNCVLVYTGGELPGFVRCTFTRTGLQLDGAATRTVDYLNTLYQGGLWSNVEAVIKRIQSGALPRTQRPTDAPPQNLGTNFATLGILHGVTFVLTVLLILAIWNGAVWDPIQKLENNQPLVEDYPLVAMPNLPESLGDAYDNLRETQLSIMAAYGQEEGAETVQIPIEDAFAILLEQGLPSQAADEEEETEDTGGTD